MKTLPITSPEQNDYHNPTVELNEKKLKKWLSDQPMLNLVQSVPILVDAIERLNEEPINGNQRSKLLESYYEPITSIFYTFDVARLQQMPITREKKTDIKTGVGKLCKDMADGYKIIIKQVLIQQKKHPSKNKHATLACFRAMEFLSLGLIHAYRTYAVAPPFSLLELHQLYKCTEHYEFTHLTFSARNSDKKLPIMELYVRTMLLSIADPFRLPDGGLIHLNDFLYRYASDCNIQAYVTERRDDLFIIDLGSDGPPKSSARLPNDISAYTDSDIGELRALSVRPLAQHVMQKINDKTEGCDKEQSFLHVLLPNLKAVRQRRSSERISVEKNAYVATGAAAIRYFLSSDSAVLQVTDDNYGIQVSDNEDSNYALNKWSIKNEALRGYLLQCPVNCDLLGVGQLLGVAQNIINPKAIPFNLTIIRWLRTSSADSVELGVETLPGQPRIVTIAGAEKMLGTVECIYLPAIPALKSPAAILLDKGLAQLQETVTLTSSQKSIQITLIKIFEQSTFFDAFHFKVIT